MTEVRKLTKKSEPSPRPGPKYNFIKRMDIYEALFSSLGIIGMNFGPHSEYEVK